MSRTPRLVCFAWAANLLLALVIALPVYAMLDDALRGSVYEQTMLEGLDQNWWLTFKENHADNPLADMLDHTVMGAAPFLAHLETILHGGITGPLADLAGSLILGQGLPSPAIGALVFLGLIGILVQALVSAGFITAYRGDFPPTITQFLSDGMQHIGPFVRMSLLVFILQAIIVYPVVGSISSWIAAGTSEQASEMTPFLLYMGRNVIAFGLFFFLSLAADYGRVYIVLHGRMGAAAAFARGMAFVASHAGLTGGVGISLIFASVLLMAAYGAAEFLLPKNTGFLVLALFLLHQAYVVCRSAIRAATYASEVAVFQSSGMSS